MQENRKEFDNTEVVFSDILKTDISKLTKEKFNKWKDAKYLIIRVQYNTTLPSSDTQPQESVLYYRHYGVDVKITTKAEIEIDEHL